MVGGHTFPLRGLKVCPPSSADAWQFMTLWSSMMKGHTDLSLGPVPTWHGSLACGCPPKPAGGVQMFLFTHCAGIPGTKVHLDET